MYDMIAITVYHLSHAADEAKFVLRDFFRYYSHCRKGAPKNFKMARV